MQILCLGLKNQRLRKRGEKKGRESAPVSEKEAGGGLLREVKRRPKLTTNLVRRREKREEVVAIMKGKETQNLPKVNYGGGGKIRRKKRERGDR